MARNRCDPRLIVVRPRFEVLIFMASAASIAGATKELARYLDEMIRAISGQELPS